MAIKDRFLGNPGSLTRTNHKPEWATEWFDPAQCGVTLAVVRRKSKCQSFSQKVVPKVEVRFSPPSRMSVQEWGKVETDWTTKLESSGGRDVDDGVGGHEATEAVWPHRCEHSRVDRG
uniref:Uncharacterized protein n=1 Tax=Oryza brachyantha TaxID=4533 RepID=J3MEJ9_ORYBR